MKYFAIATLLVGSLLIAADLLAEETIPWHWDDEASFDQQQPEETSKKQEEPSEWQSDLGW